MGVGVGCVKAMGGLVVGIAEARGELVEEVWALWWLDWGVGWREIVSDRGVPFICVLLRGVSWPDFW